MAAKHIEIYHKALGYEFTEGVFRPSELSGRQSNDIHHIERRGMGGNNEADRIENLIALTTIEHEELGDKKQYKALLYELHLNFLKHNKVEFNEDWILDQISKNKY